MTASFSPLALGSVLDGRYRIHSLLGQGGVGSVYEAEDLRLGRRVAIKVVHAHDEDGTLGERLFREAKAAARAEHPAVITAYGYGSDSELDLDYFVMERLQGETIAQQIERAGPLPLPLALRIGREVSEALIAVHAAGVIHRDLKPSNIFLRERGERAPDIKLLDFGVAKQLNLQTLTATGQVYGTPLYMAPEQLTDSKRVDARCDLYSLGVVLFECLTGEPPFRAPNALALAFAVLHGERPDPRSVRADLPRAFAEIVLRCMQCERADRYPDARAVYRALAALAL